MNKLFNILIICLLLSVVGVSAATINVPANYLTIQEAIDNALVGDDIEVDDGLILTEDLHIDQEVTIHSLGTVTIIGSHIIEANNVVIDGFTLETSGTTIIIDSALMTIDNVQITNNILDLSTSPVVGIYIGGGNPVNDLTNILIDSNTFNGPTDMVCNPIKIGGAFGSPLNTDVDGLTVSNNEINSCSFPINLQDNTLTNILIDNNVFRDTDGGVYVWALGGSPTGTLSNFQFTNNDLDSTNTYGITLGLDLTTYSDANFDTSTIIINENKFVGIPGGYGLSSVSFMGAMTSFLNTENNWFGDLDPSDNVVGNVDYDPYYLDDTMTCLSSNFLTYYLDSDGDLYGDNNISEQTCTPQPNYVLDGSDCDDNNINVNPGEIEVCDGIDNNCIGIGDDDYTPYATNCGIGECSSTGITSCVLGVEEDSCVELNSTIEVCDTLDNDCDGSIDEDLTQLDLIQEGLCAGNTLECITGIYVPDVNYYISIIEDTYLLCSDILDNDCDGEVDNVNTTCLGILPCVNTDGDIYDDCDATDITDTDGFPADCDILNNTFWQNIFGYIDNDLDSYGDVFDVGSQICSGTNLPISYSENNYDCNDSYQEVWQVLTGYNDWDNDSFGDILTEDLYCELSLPSGVVDNGLDCNDLNETLGEWLIGYNDFDLDGYGINPPIKECLLELSPNLVENNLDCDDNNNLSTYVQEPCIPSCESSCKYTDNTCTLVTLYGTSCPSEDSAGSGWNYNTGGETSADVVTEDGYEWVLIKEGTQVDFYVWGVHHSATVNKVNIEEGYVEMTIQSTPKNIIAYLNKPVPITIDNVFLELEVTNIYENGKVSFLIREYQTSDGGSGPGGAVDSDDDGQQEQPRSTVGLWITILVILVIICIGYLVLKGKKKKNE